MEKNEYDEASFVGQIERAEAAQLDCTVEKMFLSARVSSAPEHIKDKYRSRVYEVLTGANCKSVVSCRLDDFDPS